MSARTVLTPVLVALALVVPGAPLSAQMARPVDIPERFRGADTAVVARVAKVTTALERNEWGDELIVSHAVLEVEEALKGRPSRFETLAVEGGTYGGYTMRVSDLPEVGEGERGVFFMKRNSSGVKVPHLRGLGILLLDENDRVRGSSLSLDMIRSMSRKAEQ